MIKKIIFCLAVTSTTAFACPNGYYEVCVLPRPFVGGCAQTACMPSAPVQNPLDNARRVVEDKAIGFAISAKESNQARNQSDCTTVVVAALVAWGSNLGAPWGMLVGGAAGLATASMACRSAFPE